MYQTDVVLKYSAKLLSQGMPLNVATVPGTMMSDCAKMIGITPALLMRSGMNVFWPSRILPRPITLRGICTGMRRAATVIATVPATTSTHMISTIISTGKLSVPVFNASKVFTVSGRMRSMIEKKMSRLIPLPIPRILPETVNTFEALKTGTLSFPVLMIVLIMCVLVVAGTVAITVAARRIPVQIPRKVMGRGRIREGQKTFIPLRINSAGVMPIIFAQSLIIVPGTVATFSGVPWLKSFAEYFNTTSVWYIASSAVLIVFFAYFYTSIIFNPVDLAENLKKQGAFIPGVKPGAATADYIDEVLTRITLPGALFLTFVALLPIVVQNTLNMPFGFGGTALLIVVGVALDTVQQVQQHLLLRQYDGFMKGGGPGGGTSRVRFRR